MFKKIFMISGVAVMLISIGVAGVFAQDSDQEEAWLGVSIADTNNGEVVIRQIVKDSPAEEAELERGDIIVSINGEAVATVEDITDFMDAASPADVVTLEILRDDETLEIEITLSTMPDNIEIYEFGDRDGNGNNGNGDNRGGGRGGFGSGGNMPNFPHFDFDGGMMHFTAEVLLHADLEVTDEGYVVTNVYGFRNNDDEENTGLAEGDIVTAINGTAITDLDVEILFTDLAEMDEPHLSIAVLRDGEELTLEIGEFFGGFGWGRGRDDFGGRAPFDHHNAPNDTETEAVPEGDQT